MMSKDCSSVCPGLVYMSFSKKGGSTIVWFWIELVTLVGSTILATGGSNVVGMFEILVIRGGLGAGKVVLDLKCISTTFRV